jgi:LemA protein
MKMEKWLILVIVGILLLIFVVIPVIAYIVIQNNLVGLDVACDEAWANVRVQYQRRYDLIPKLEEMVERYMQYEQSLLTNITQLRSEWPNLQQMTPEQQQVFTEKVENFIINFRATAENYPDLKASQLFQDFMAELAGTENRIAVARTRYNEAVKNYNTGIRVFPNNIVAGMMGLQKRNFFLGSEGIENPPPPY